MANDLSFSELAAEHVELLPARTLVTAVVPAAQTAGISAGSAGALSGNGGVVDAIDVNCQDVPVWAPKPPGC